MNINMNTNINTNMNTNINTKPSVYVNVPITSLAKQKIYLAGPMRGYPKYNKPVFDSVSKYLRRVGAKVFNPAEADEKIRGFVPDKNMELPYRSKTLRTIFAQDTKALCLWANNILLLPKWKFSNGAVAEYYLARALGLRILEWHTENYSDFSSVKIIELEAQKS